MNVGDVFEIGKFEELNIEYPAKFYDNLDDEAPLFARTPFDAPNWQGSIVAVLYDDGPREVFLLGKNYWDALKKLADEIWRDYLDGTLKETDLTRFWLDYDEDGEVYQFAVTAEDEKGERYAFIATRDGERSMILCDEGKVFEGWALREPAPEEVKKRMLEDLLRVYFD